MRPAARVQAAIEMIASVLARRQPADRLSDEYLRARRYVGSKDRRAIADLVYRVLRHRGRLEWAMGEVPTDPLSHARSLVIAELAATGAIADQLFDGSQYGPALLSERERRLIGTEGEGRGSAPPWVLANCPPWLTPEFAPEVATNPRVLLGDPDARAPLDLRVNTLRATREEVLVQLQREGIAAVPTPIAPNGIRVAGSLRLDAHQLFRDGTIEVQDEGSQIVAAVCRAVPNEIVIDFCAGAGGKTLAFAAAMGGRGRLVACDVDSRRLGELERRARRAGATNITTHIADAALAAPAIEQGDLVVLDVPCSGSGTWRRNPDAPWRLSPEVLEGYRDSQRRILASGANLVRPHGRLAYITCSLFPSENGAQIEAFLAAHPAWRRRDLRADWQRFTPRPWPGTDDGDLVLAPGTTETDGFFLAIVEPAAK